MRTARHIGDADGLATLDAAETQVLSALEERTLLRDLGDCKAKLAEALAKVRGAEPPDGADDPQALAQYITSFYASDGPAEARLGAIYHRYKELRGKLAMANMRLVAHVAKRFRDRGIAYSDLLQEGFCGLLEAIDRFNLTHETKLATYATWWIRQAMQAPWHPGPTPSGSARDTSGSSQNQDEIDGPEASATEARGASPEMIRRIHTATRPTVSLDATFDGDTNFTLLQTMSDPEGDRTDDVDTDEAIGKLLATLRPREQRVLELRFGLQGAPRLSLSQVGTVLEVSKERVRQIQDRALEKLRAVAAEHNLFDALSAGV